MAANVLVRNYKVPLKDYFSIDISPDTHIKRVFYRMGLVDKKEGVDMQVIDPFKVIYKARDINPEFPGILDPICWSIGSQGICTNSHSKCNECALNGICKKVGVSQQV
jgi:endonuclease III